MELRDGTRKNWQTSLTHTCLHKTNTKWFVHSWSTFGARTNYGQTRTHKTHHGLDLGEATTFPLVVYFVPSHEAHIPKLGLLQLWGPIISRANLWLRWGRKKNYSHCREISNGMSHVTFTQVNWVDSRLLMVGSQTANLIPSLSFGHNLCFRCANGWCEPILHIYVPKDFQWYKKLFNPLGFDPYNQSLNIWKSTRTLTPKMGVPLRVWRPIPSPLMHSQGHAAWLLGFPLGLQPCNPLL